MSGVWVFKNGVARLVSNPLMEPIDGSQRGIVRRKVLVHVPTNEIITSYSHLEAKLLDLGWERYPYEEPDLIQFHKISSVDLISLPADFARFKTIHMYDIVVKNRSLFESWNSNGYHSAFYSTRDVGRFNNDAFSQLLLSTTSLLSGRQVTYTNLDDGSTIAVILVTG